MASSGGRAGVRRWGWAARGAVPAGVVAAAFLASPTARSQSLTGYVEINGTRSEQTTRGEDAPETRGESDGLVQRLNLTYTQPLWPNFYFLTGGFFERNRATNDGEGLPSDSRLTRLRPFATLRLTTPIFRAEVGADRNETRDESGSSERKRIRDRATAALGWHPNSTDYVQVLLYRTDDHDAERTDVDQLQSTASITSQVRLAPPLTLQYEGLSDRIEDRLERSEQSTDVHTARVRYSDGFFDRRLVISTDYRVSRTHVSTRATGDEESFLRLVPDGGLSSVDDTPERDRLQANAFLVDRERSVPAAVNLVWQPPDGNDDARNLGVEFGLPTEVRRFRVWVDRDLLPEISASFSWEIWSSDDGETWVRGPAISTAEFDSSWNRFQLTFAGVRARFVKVVTRPIALQPPLSTEYPAIEVTELEAFGPAAEGDVRSTAHQYNFNARVRLLDAPFLYYDVNYLLNSVSPGGRRTFLVNGISLAESLSPVWSVAARVANESVGGSFEHRAADVYSASLTAVPLPALRSSVLVSGRRESLGGTRRDSDTVLFNASATPYRGIDVSAGVGRSWQTESGRLTTTTIVNVGAQLSPNPFVGLNLSYDDGSRKETGGGRPDADDPNRAFEVGVTVNPLPTLYLYGSNRVEKRQATGRRTLHNLSASWSPFPNGSLRFSLYYNEYYESEFDALTRTGGPSLRWNLNRRTYVTLGYERTRSESTLQSFDRSGYYGSLRVGF